ncbi:hypothetical protein Z043_113080 [Scleropages formosus]|uniref:Uncharacterized protein n=1 Tax=Scleropages formosus TaxID=113540 RepID=A0A0P7U271_SCLFO|nr:hypothetical protein Z043_113080 [Scleropages formosus]
MRRNKTNKQRLSEKSEPGSWTSFAEHRGPLLDPLVGPSAAGPSCGTVHRWTLLLDLPLLDPPLDPLLDTWPDPPSALRRVRGAQGQDEAGDSGGSSGHSGHRGDRVGGTPMCGNGMCSPPCGRCSQECGSHTSLRSYCLLPLEVPPVGAASAEGVAPTAAAFAHKLSRFQSGPIQGDVATPPQLGGPSESPVTTLMSPPRCHRNGVTGSRGLSFEPRPSSRALWDAAAVAHLQRL